MSQTPYGRVLKTCAVAGTDGSEVAIPYVCPFAWLYRVCEACPHFVRLLRASLGAEGRGSIVIYHDETQPGNVRRPDVGRKFLALYWGIVELPDWFQSRQGFGRRSSTCLTRSSTASRAACLR